MVGGSPAGRSHRKPFPAAISHANYAREEMLINVLRIGARRLPVDGRENCDCHAHNDPSDEQGVDDKLNQSTLLNHALPSARMGSREESDSL